MKPSIQHSLKKAAKISGIVLVSVLTLLFILPYLFPETISKKIKTWVNGTLTSKLEFSRVNLSFYNHFPALTLTLHDVSLTGSAPFEKDTLIKAKEIALGLHLSTIFSNSIKIDKVFFSDAIINVQVNQKGQANYNIYKTSGKKENPSDSSEATGLELESIVIENSFIRYNDQSIPLEIIAENFNYTGKGDLAKSVFDLTTRLSADAFSFIYNGQAYLNKKELSARLITKVNTNSLALIFERNKLRINRLPVFFSGRFDFLKNGYDMDFRLASPKATLEQVISALPPDLSGWLSDTKVKGDAAFNVWLKGQYIVETGSMPTLEAFTRVRNGFISHKQAPAPVENLFVTLYAKIPSLNSDSMDIKLDTLDFTIEKGFVNAKSHTIGLEQPYIKSTIKANVDLEKWDKAIGLAALDLKGQLTLDVETDGYYRKGQNPKKLRKDIIVTSIPTYKLKAAFTNGYLHYHPLPEAITELSFELQSECKDSILRHVTLLVDKFNAKALNNQVRGYAHITSPDNPDINIRLSAAVKLDELQKFIPLDSLQLFGKMDMNVQSKGIYNPGQKRFPATSADFNIRDGSLRTAYYPNPIDKINLQGKIENSSGAVEDTRIDIQSLAFAIENKPFTASARFINPEDLAYELVADGTIDVGKIYKVFAVKGYDTDGLIETHLKLKGRQSDAQAGRYNRLENEGVLLVKKLSLAAEAFPKPIHIETGKFSFKQDKMLFESFQANYAGSRFTLNGYLNNVIHYLVGTAESLKGSLTFAAGHLNVNDFTALDSSPTPPTAPDSIKTNTATGVVIVPDNLSLQLKATADSIVYNGVLLRHFKGEVLLDTGAIQLKKTGFKLIDANFMMNARYKATSSANGQFEFSVKADSFSIARAYAEIPLFRDMVSSASGVEGLVGLDYNITGRINENMEVVLPSLKGGGTLSLLNIRLKGFRLLNAVSESTEYKELKDAAVSGIKIKSAVKNNILTIDRVKLRIAGFRPRFEGQASLDGALNMKGRVGLPPLGIIGIPFTISGTSDNPQVKLKRDKSGKVLKEKEDQEEVELEDESAPTPAEPVTN